MKGWLKRHFLSMLSLIALVLAMVLVIGIFEGPTIAAGYDQLSDNTVESGVTASGNVSSGYIMFDLNDSDRSPINKTPKTSEQGSFGFSNFTLIFFNDSDRSYKTSKTNGFPELNFSNSTSLGFPVYREVVIVYFKEMPLSVDDFASSYNVSTVFVKGDIKMAAFESNPVKVGGVVSERTTLAIESISKDPRVESVKRDTHMFVNPNAVIKTTPNVRYPGDNVQEDVELIPNQVMVGFWRLPPSLEEFGEKYGGKPINVTESLLSVETVIYEADDLKTFIDLASKDPYVEYIEPNEIVHIVLD